MRLTFCLTIICLMQILLNVNATKGTYTVIAPGTIHCDEKYTAAVAVHNTALPCKIRVGITGPSYAYSKQFVISKYEVKHFEFIFRYLKKGDYNLTAEGIDCLDNFKDSTELLYRKFHNHVIIEADKDFYQPGDNINFRVLFLDKDLRPVQPEQNALIWIADGKGNQIEEIKGFKTSNGVYTGNFKISKHTVTGNWHLGVRNGDGFDRTLHFDVDKYILPKFVVEVKATKSVSVKDGDIQVIVRANYNYGKPLDGKVNVVLFLESNDCSKNTGSPILGKTAIIKDGKVKLDFNIKGYDEYLCKGISPSYMSIVATVEEKFTSVQINGTASIAIYPYRYSKNCINYEDFATSTVYNKKDVLFQLTYIDGSYLNDTKSTIELICKEFTRKNNWWHHERILDNDSLVPLLSNNYTAIFKRHMNETGFVNFKVTLPVLPQYEGYSHYYSLELKYLDEQQEVCNSHIYWYQKQVNSAKNEEEKPKEYFKLEPKYWSDHKLYLKKASKFVLNSSQPLSYFDYNIIGRGNILESGRLILSHKPKVYNLTLTPQFLWAPSFYVYVNYIDESGEYHYAEHKYEVVLELENQINVTVAKQVKPGEEVAFKIQTAPNSFVGLMAIDQASFLLRTDNGLDFHELNKILGSYSTYTPPQTGYFPYAGEMSGCVTLTNADYFYSRIWPKKTKRNVFPEANQGVSMYSTARTNDASNLRAHKGFSQTWFFADIQNTEASEFFWIKKIPEAITSWVLTAFSLNPQKGLGVTREQTKITTFLPFSISIRLPYSIKKGEVINVPAWVFNFLDKALDVDVILHNIEDEYEFIEFDNQVFNEQKLSKSIRIPSNGAAGVSFLIKPKVVGNIMLNFTAISAAACDSIHKSLKVILEGITLYGNRGYFVNLNKGPKFEFSFILDLPQDSVPGSEHVEVGVTGDILGPVFDNLDNLVRLPTGCGEQTVSSLLPNYLVLKYLKDSKRLTSTMEIKLRYNLKTGYQNILNYRHKDGSFSSFGPAQVKGKPRNGSTWLTAYVVRSLQQIKEFINVDGYLIEGGLEYLSKQQAVNGTFTEKGDYLYVSQRNHVTITSAVVLAIMENPTYAERYYEQLSKGLEFIASNIGKSDSLHAQAIGTFTLNKAKYITAKEEISKLKNLAKVKSGRKWWSAVKPQLGHKWWPYVFSNDVEITSYALLTLMDQYSTKIHHVLPIINWLITQRNSKGGFASTQDTVVGLTALIEFIKFANNKPAEMNVDIKSKETKETINLTKDNEVLYQYIEMPPKTKSIDFTAKGTGTALVQIAYQTNVFNADPNPSFTIKIIKNRNINMLLQLQLSVCVSYVGEGKSSNMALMEVYTPSGYVINEENSKEIMKMKTASKTELKNSDSLLVVYFDHLYKKTEICFIVEAVRVHAVSMQKPVPIIVYDYYDARKRANAFYEVESTLCDICETKEECSKCKYLHIF